MVLVLLLPLGAFVAKAVASLARGGTKELGVQLSFRKAAIEGVVNESAIWGLVIAKGAGFLLMAAGNSPPRAIRAISTRIICLMRSAFPSGTHKAFRR